MSPVALSVQHTYYRSIFLLTAFLFLLPEGSPAQFAGPLRVNPVNRRYFTDNAGRSIYLTGSHTWSTLQDNGVTDPPPVFNYTGYLNFLQANNHNFFRLYSWEQARWTVETADNYYFTPLPFQRTGPDTALDGKPKFDLTAFNQAYFDRLRQRCIDAGARGIYIAVMLFNGWSIESPKGVFNQQNPWRAHPFNRTNNINGIDGDPTNTSNGTQVQTLNIPAVYAIQKAYVRKVIETVNDLDNILYEISNESGTQSTNWQYDLIQYVRSYEATLPKQHPVGMTAEWPGGADATLFASTADWISPNTYDVQADGSKVIIIDTDHVFGIGGDRKWAWRRFMEGQNPIFMDGYDGKATGVGGEGFDSTNATWVSFRKNMGYTRTYANRINLTAVTPRGNLSSTGLCLANPVTNQAEYLTYAPNGGAITLNLSAVTGTLSVEWFNPATGVATAGASTTGGASRTLTPPFSGDAVLYVYNPLVSSLPSGTITATPSTLPLGGGSFTLGWTSLNATTASIDQGIGSVALSGSLNISISVTTTYTLTLTNASGSLTYAVTATVPLPPPPTPPEGTIYADNNLLGTWNDIRSWGVALSYINPSPVYQGPTSLKVTYSAWGSLQFSQGNWGAFTSIDPAGQQSLDFAVHGGTAGVTLSVTCLNSSGSNLKPAVNVVAPANVWTFKSIPMSQLATTPYIAVAFTAGGTNKVFYLDVVRLVPKSLIPAVPGFTSPVSGAIQQPTTVTLGWTAVSGATTYHVQVAIDSLFTAPIVNDSTLTGTSTSVGPLANNTLYYRRIRARNAAGTSAFSPVSWFTTIVAPPPVPTLLTPVQEAIDVPASTSLTWSSSPDAISYRLQLAADSLFISIVVDDTTLTVPSRQVGPLSGGVRFFWRVRSKNAGGTLGYTPPWAFTTVVTPPAPPVLLSPPNNAVSVPTSVTLTWNQVLGAARYRVQLSSDSLFGQMLVDDSVLTAAARTVDGLDNKTMYFWRASGSNSAGTGNSSPTWRFTTIVTPPSTPVPLSPDSGATNQPRTLTLSWTPVTDASSYRLHVSSDSLFGTTVINDSSITSASRQVGPLAGITQFFWRVQAKNIAGTSPLSVVRTFTTVIAPPPSPTLVAPANASSGLPLTITLSWNAAAGAVLYRVQVATDSLFAGLFFDDSTLTTTSTDVASLTNGVRYYWRVSARNDGGYSSPSAFRYFTTIPLPPVPPVLLSPANGSVGQPVMVTLSWQASPGAATYRAQLATDSLFTAKIIDDSLITVTSRQAGPLASTTRYYWRVFASNAGGISASSPVWTLTTGTTFPPNTVVLYTENALTSPWTSVRSWSTTTLYTSTSPVFVGATSARFTMSAWGSLQFSKGTWGSFVSTDPSGFQSLDFALHGGTTGVSLSLTLLDANGTALKPAVTVTAPANAWAAKSIPMSQLAAAPFIAIALTSGGTARTFSLDEIRLIGTSVAPTAALPAVQQVADVERLPYLLVGEVSLHPEVVHSMALPPVMKHPPSMTQLARLASAWRTLTSVTTPLVSDGTPLSGFPANSDGSFGFDNLAYLARGWDWREGEGNRPDDVGRPEGDVVQIEAAATLSVQPAGIQLLPVNFITQGEISGVVIDVRVRGSELVVDSVSVLGSGPFLAVLPDPASAGFSIPVQTLDAKFNPGASGFGTMTLRLRAAGPMRGDSLDITCTAYRWDGTVAAVVSKSIVVRTVVPLPVRFALAQNYPNPFNPATSIYYELPASGPVKLEVFDLLGRRVATLVDAEQEAGFYTARWDAQGAATGIYFYRLETGSAHETKRMLLLR